MGRYQHCLAGPLRQHLDAAEHLLAFLRVQAGRRLVENEQVGVVNDRLRKLQLLPHAGGVAIDLAVPLLLGAAEVEDLVRAAEGLYLGNPPQTGGELHHLDARQPRDVAVIFGHVADAGPRRTKVRPETNAQHLATS